MPFKLTEIAAAKEKAVIDKRPLEEKIEEFLALDLMSAFTTDDIIKGVENFPLLSGTPDWVTVIGAVLQEMRLETYRPRYKVAIAKLVDPGTVHTIYHEGKICYTLAEQ